MPINMTPPWAHLQRADPSLPSYTKGRIGYTPYVGKEKIFGPKQNSQTVVMFARAKKDPLHHSVLLSHDCVLSTLMA